MLQSLTLLLIFQALGEGIAYLLRLPVPGPVIGMLALLLMLALRPGMAVEMQDTNGALLRHLSLLFVPAGTGIIVHTDKLGGQWLAIGVALVCSTALAIATTAVLLDWLMRRQAQADSSNGKGSMR